MGSPRQGCVGTSPERAGWFHRFQTVSADLIAVNEKICRLRPAEPEQGAWTPQEKKRLLKSIARSLAK